MKFKSKVREFPTSFAPAYAEAYAAAVYMTGRGEFVYDELMSVASLMGEQSYEIEGFVVVGVFRYLQPKLVSPTFNIKMSRVKYDLDTAGCYYLFRCSELNE